MKVDQGFLLAVLWLFDLSAADEETRRLAAFHSDCRLVDRSLMDDMVHTTADMVKNFYDMLHISPFKVSTFSLSNVICHEGCLTTQQFCTSYPYFDNLLGSNPVCESGCSLLTESRNSKTNS